MECLWPLLIALALMFSCLSDSMCRCLSDSMCRCLCGRSRFCRWGVLRSHSSTRADQEVDRWSSSASATCQGSTRPPPMTSPKYSTTNFSVASKRRRRSASPSSRWESTCSKQFRRRRHDPWRRKPDNKTTLHSKSRVAELPLQVLTRIVPRVNDLHSDKRIRV